MKIGDQLEPAAKIVGDADLRLDDQITHLAALSQAISLKRIADCLEKLTSDHGLLSENFFWQLGDSFGQGLQVGQRR